jgi:hypothetical protein
MLPCAAATDVAPQLLFHWMVPEYNNEGALDYGLLLENLKDWLDKHLAGPHDVLVIQASVILSLKSILQALTMS